ncbi:hypothetical protein BDW59DRAFT_36804 [Aspergillus cavernicola]|uniref:PD-(D/E)XK nuclease-like domain-containing protein n=1 Tax=Aspergillus cavernicola TaxID=176166 RepID=A0ABR4HB69_9EURO
MDDMKRATIKQWIESILHPAIGAKPRRRIDQNENAFPTSQQKRKRDSTEESLTMPDFEPPKRLRPPDNDDASTPPLRNDVSIPPSTATASSRQRQRSSSPKRIKAGLKQASPAIKYLPSVMDPENDAAKELFSYLAHDDEPNPWQPGILEVAKLSEASSKCKVELRSEGSWVIQVAWPLLQLAVGELPLDCWSVQTETVDVRYQPKYTARDTFNRKLDLVVGLPIEKWARQYEAIAAVGIDGSAPSINQSMSHIDHPHTGDRLLGIGFEVKASDGNLDEAEVQLGVWMAGLVSWMWERRCGTPTPPPVIGCISIGDQLDFYIVYGVEGANGELDRVCVWGPLSDLSGRLGSHKSTCALIKTMRRVMQYTSGRYVDLLVHCIAGHTYGSM